MMGVYVESVISEKIFVKIDHQTRILRLKLPNFEIFLIIPNFLKYYVLCCLTTRQAPRRHRT